mmetsp:Transcript_1983/g.3151  ORF Transcript_1983/g.3151 Transcript_1983/m.3151 type:complete len:132 (-) Transcript_1983:246-641(-)
MSAAELAAEQERYARLKAELAALQGASMSEPVPDVPKSNEKAAAKLLVIQLSEKKTELEQKLERKELQVKHLNAQMKEDQEDLRSLNEKIDAARNSGLAVWETVGRSTHPYSDPFHTGLSKRTPNGGFFTS